MSQFLPKLTRYVPLWQQNIPRYPIYWKGNPQLRVFLPLFWMKMVKSERKLPADTVMFEVHHQMTKFDVKNYLEKIYDVKVLSVKCHNLRGEKRTHPTYGYESQPDRNKRIAWVQLEDSKFEFPDIFKGKETEEAKTSQDMMKNAEAIKQTAQRDWSKMDLPPWFR